MEIIPTIRTDGAQNAPPSYQAYLNSPHWKVTRNAALRRAGWMCERCPSKRDLQVHHRSYQRLGAELPGDLEVVCFRCHNGHHRDEAENEQNELGLLLKIVSTVLERNVFARIPDISEDTKILCAEKGIRYRPHVLQKAVQMVCGTRQKDRWGKPYVSVIDAPADITEAQATELMVRLETVLGVNISDLVASMPTLSPGNGRKHQDAVRHQADAMRWDRPVEKRKPVRQRLEDIFAGRE